MITSYESNLVWGAGLVDSRLYWFQSNSNQKDGYIMDGTLYLTWMQAYEQGEQHAGESIHIPSPEGDICMTRALVSYIGLVPPLFVLDAAELDSEKIDERVNQYTVEFLRDTLFRYHGLPDTRIGELKDIDDALMSEGGLAASDNAWRDYARSLAESGNIIGAFMLRDQFTLVLKIASLCGIFIHGYQVGKMDQLYDLFCDTSEGLNDAMINFLKASYEVQSAVSASVDRIIWLSDSSEVGSEVGSEVDNE